MGTAGQSGGQQGRHLGEAHRSAEHIHTGTLTFQQVFERTDFTVYTRSIKEYNILLVNTTNVTDTANNNYYKLQLCNLWRCCQTPFKKMQNFETCCGKGKVIFTGFLS